jgi:hypothetical protein
MIYVDAVLSYTKLKNGGYLIFDDYDLEGVKLAVDEFQKKYPVHLLHKKSQVIFQKKRIYHQSRNNFRPRLSRLHR